MLILASMAVLVVDVPHLPKAHALKRALVPFNVAFTVLFGLEMRLKIADFGLARSKTPEAYGLVRVPYLREPWNILDMFIVVISILSLAQIPGSQGVRSLRGLRCLRLVSRYEDLKLTVDTLFMCLHPVRLGAMLMIALIFFIIFAILGVELFGGKFGSCEDPMYADLPYGWRAGRG